MRTTSLFTLTAAVAALIGVANPAQAAGSIDQSNVAATPDTPSQTIANNLTIPGTGTFDLAGLQFVTAGVSGQLTQVDLQLAQALNQGVPVPVGSGVLYIAKNVAIDLSGHATGNVLSQLAFNTNIINGFNTWTSLDVSGLNLNFNAGDQFVIALEGTDDANASLYRWATTGNSSYAGGDGYLGVDSTAQGNYTWLASGTNVPARDYGFRTWVQAVPEPGTWLLMIVGLGLIGFVLRREGSKPASQAITA